MNTIGKIFSVTNWGESHGKAIGVVVDGCPAGLDLVEEDFDLDMARRRPGQSRLSTQRMETDKVAIASGVFEGKTTGAPISLIIYNQDQRSQDYSDMMDVFRPGHADFTYFKKYGHRDYRGGGRTSARVTAGTVAAGVIAKKILRQVMNIAIIGFVDQIGKVSYHHDFQNIRFDEIEKNLVRCPNKSIAQMMEQQILDAMRDGDSVGGVVACILQNVPAGFGGPIYGKLNADLAHAMMSINASRGVEFGSGFQSANYRGSELNDPFVCAEGEIRTLTNNCGGILGGISNGMDINFRVAFKPTSTIAHRQQTVNQQGTIVELAAGGRHDPCVVPRAVPVVEAMAAIIICDHYLRNQTSSFNL
ncbi:MAG: chorismate synthase [Candidatus Marinimicrobia bacterium]|nr:chorismate synthase [Candidatus Neomarinimicrobiota bacterium]